MNAAASATLLRDLRDLADAIGRVDTLEQVYQVALQSLRRTLAVDRSSLLLLDHQRVMRFCAWDGLSDAYRAIAEGHSPWPPDATDAATVLVPDVAQEPSLESLRSKILGEGIRALAFVPLTQRGRLLGKFMLYWDQPHACSEHEVQVAELIAGQVAFAIERISATAQLDAILQQLPVGIVVTEAPSGRMILHNQYFREFWQGAFPLASEPTPYDLNQWFHPDGRPYQPAEWPLVRASAGKAVLGEEIHLQRADGTHRTVRVNAAPIRDAAGQVSGATAAIFDVTQERELQDARLRLFQAEALARAEAVAAQRSLRESRDELEAILRGVSDGITVQAPDGRLLYANDAAARLVGFPTAEALAASDPREIVRHFELLDETGQPLPPERLPGRRALHGETVSDMPVRFRVLATGEERWSTVTGSPVFDAEGNVRFAVNIIHDITERQRAEHRLEFLAASGAYLATSLDVEATLRAITQLAISTLADWTAVFLVDDHDESVRAAAAAHRDPALSGAADDLLRRYPLEPFANSPLWATLQTGEPQVLHEVPDALLVRAARSEEHLRSLRTLGLRSALWVPLVAGSRVLGALSLFSTRTSHRFTREDVAVAVEVGRRAALAIENARLYQETREALRARDQFLSIASHELKTPIAGVKAAAQLLLRLNQRGQATPERLTQTLQRMNQMSDRLTVLTNDLLDVSRVRLGQLALQMEPLDLRAVVQDVAARYDDALDPGHTLRLDLPAEPLLVEADRGRIDQVLTNLIDNAFKYSPRGGVVALDAQPDGQGVRIQVRDQGIGLPRESLETIFVPFSRAPNAEASHLPGMGLGLYICRGILDRHAGRIWADSPGEGQGTTLSVWLPCLDRTSDHPW